MRLYGFFSCTFNCLFGAKTDTGNIKVGKVEQVSKFVSNRKRNYISDKDDFRSSSQETFLTPS